MSHNRHGSVTNVIASGHDVRGMVSPSTVHHRATQIDVLARSQRNIATVAELGDLGVAKATIADWIRAGRWQRVHRGVVYLGCGILPRDARFLAAVKASGGRAVLSDPAGAEHLGLLRWKSRRIDVTKSTSSGRTHRGFTTHRSTDLPDHDRIVHDGIPTFAPARAIVDLARFIDCYELVGSIDLAHRRSRIGPDDIETCSNRFRSMRGHAELRVAIAHYRAGSHGIRGRVEAVLARAMRACGMPTPLLNVVLETPRGPYMIDLYLPAMRCGVELDDHGHDQPHMVASDRQRDLAFLEAGIAHIRVPNEAVDQMLDAVLDRVEALLRSRGWRGTRTA